MFNVQSELHVLLLLSNTMVVAVGTVNRASSVILPSLISSFAVIP